MLLLYLLWLSKEFQCKSMNMFQVYLSERSDHYCSLNTLLENLPMVIPWMRMLNTTAIYVTTKRISRVSLSGSDSTNANDKPPRKPPQMMTFASSLRMSRSLGNSLLGTLTAKQQTLYTRQTYLHAKFILFTMPDKSQVAISGSHNFMYGSGAIGTKEVAIETSDPHLIKQLTKFYRQHIA